MSNTSLTDPSLSETRRDQLEAVRVALLEDARTRATEITDAARADADAIVADATARADREVQRAEEAARGASLARSEQTLEMARADANQRILRTRATIDERILDATRRAVLELREDPRYPGLLDHLERLARSQLGADEVIERDPEGAGGIIGHLDGRRVDYTLATLADRALDQLGDDIERLWT